MAKEGEGTESGALAMVMARQEALANEQAARDQAMMRVLTATTDNMTQIQQEVKAELAAERARSDAAFAEVAKKFQELAEARPDDPKTRAEILKLELQEAKKEMIARKARFGKALETMTLGIVNSHEPHPISVGVNGYYVVIQPGLNRDIPAAFIEEWERRIRTQEWAEKVALSFEVQDEEVPDANAIQQISGKPMLWNEETGAV
ncbi:MAG: hypothetical protein ACYSTI_12320 [Planctomycetota bacterium]